MIIVAATTINTGPVKGIFQLIEKSGQSDYKFYLCNFKIDKNDEFKKFAKEAEQLKIPTFFFNQQKRSYWSLFYQARQFIMKNKINLVQTHGFKPSIIGLFLKFFCKIKWICFMHGTTAENFKVKLYHFIDNCVQLFSDRVVIVTKKQRGKIFGGKNIKRVRVIHNAVNIEKPAKLSKTFTSIHDKYGINHKNKIITAIGRFSHEKGFDILVDSFEIVSREYKNAVLVLLGDGPEKDKINLQISEKNLKEKVLLPGFSKTPGDFIQYSDMIVLPSRSEGIPNVALEAMAFSKPVVATDVGGNAEVINHGISGIIVPSEDIYSLSTAMLEILKHEKYADQLAKNGNRRVKQFFSPKVRVDLIFKLYQEVLN